MREVLVAVKRVGPRQFGEIGRRGFDQRARGRGAVQQLPAEFRKRLVSFSRNHVIAEARPIGMVIESHLRAAQDNADRRQPGSQALNPCRQAGGVPDVRADAYDGWGFLCNAGGVTVSYFEMVQNFYMYYWDADVVYHRLDKKMTTAYHAVLNTSKKYNINMRQAAYVVAVERVVEAMKLRGWS